jgi:hypothetical protein
MLTRARHFGIIRRGKRGSFGQPVHCHRGLLPQPQPSHRAGDDRQRFMLSIKDFPAACKRLGLRQIFTRPYTPKTNGKAERFIQTALREWAYARDYQNSDQRTAELFDWLHRYNWHRPHEGQHAHQSPRFIPGQPVEAPQLDANGFGSLPGSTGLRG